MELWVKKTYTHTTTREVLPHETAKDQRNPGRAIFVSCLNWFHNTKELFPHYSFQEKKDSYSVVPCYDRKPKNGKRSDRFVGKDGLRY